MVVTTGPAPGLLLCRRRRRQKILAIPGRSVFRFIVSMVHSWFFCVKRIVSMSYVELQVTTNFSFLRGASHPEELVEQAAAYGYKEIAITDRNSFAGIVRAHVAAKKHKIRLIPALRLDLLDGPSLLAYPTDRSADSRLCNLASRGNLRAE